jgi:hypothetical protein
VCGLNQPPDTGWTITGRTLTLTGGAATFGLLAEHDLHVEYDYLTGAQAFDPSGTFIAAAQATTNSSTVSVDVPLETEAGDLLIFIASRATAFTTPTDFDFYDSTVGTPTGNEVFIWTKEADGTETTVATTATAAAGPTFYLNAALIVLRGIDTTDPIAAAATAGGTGTTGATFAAATVAVPSDSVYVLYVVIRDTTSANDFIEAPDTVNTRANPTVAGGRHALHVADEAVAPSTTTTTRTFTDPEGQAGASWGSFTLAMRSV